MDDRPQKWDAGEAVAGGLGGDPVDLMTPGRAPTPWWRSPVRRRLAVAATAIVSALPYLVGPNIGSTESSVPAYAATVVVLGVCAAFTAIPSRVTRRAMTFFALGLSFLIAVVQLPPNTLFLWYFWTMADLGDLPPGVGIYLSALSHAASLAVASTVVVAEARFMRLARP